MSLSDKFELVLRRYKCGYYSDKDNKVKCADGTTEEQRAVQDLLDAVMDMIKRESGR